MIARFIGICNFIVLPLRWINKFKIGRSKHRGRRSGLCGSNFCFNVWEAVAKLPLQRLLTYLGFVAFLDFFRGESVAQLCKRW